jgi:predicted alpha/beta-fold hydrolase
VVAGYRVRGLLRNAHLQTVLPNFPPWRTRTRWRARALRGAATRWLLDCGDGVRLEAWHTPAAADAGAASGVAAAPRANAPCAVLLHGWEGSVESCYLLSLGSALLAAGYQVLRLHLRDHGGTQSLNEGLFHSCRLDDVTGALRAIAARLPGVPLCLAGFSLGGNFMLRAAAEPGLPRSVAGVVAISPVLHPERAMLALEQGWFAYERYFVRRWQRSLRGKQLAWPGRYAFEPLVSDPRLRPMTDVLVRTYAGFATMQAYLEGYAITGARLLTLGVPAGVLLADDDPIIPVDDHQHLARTPWLEVVRTPHGGHCGFLEDWRGNSYADRFVLARFARYLGDTSPDADADADAGAAADPETASAAAASAR